MNEHLLKRRWMEEHGYTLLGGIYDIQISVPNHSMDKELKPIFKHMVSIEQVNAMTIDELELYDQNVWLTARESIARLAEATNMGRGHEKEEAE